MKMWTKNVLCRDMGTSNHISARDENSTRMPAQAFDKSRKFFWGGQISEALPQKGSKKACQILLWYSKSAKAKIGTFDSKEYVSQVLK
jgi:hypothetical protein